MGIVQNAVYCAGGRKVEPASLESTFELLREQRGMAWIGLYRPSHDELAAVADEFGLHPLAVEDAVAAHQRPKIERYGDVLFTVLRPARHVRDRVELGELHVFTGPDFVVTIRHAESPDVATIRRRMEAEPSLLDLGPESVLYAILDQVVDEYAPVVEALEAAADQIEADAFAEHPEASRRIYALTREVSVLQRAVASLLPVLESLTLGSSAHDVPQELQRRLRDVQDHALRLADRVDALRSQLQNILTVSSTLVTRRQTDEMQRLTEATYRQGEQVKRISSWAAILFSPTLVPTVYGMNFTHMPELGWRLGYPLALLLMTATFVVLYVAFRRRGWL